MRERLTQLHEQEILYELFRGWNGFSLCNSGSDFRSDWILQGIAWFTTIKYEKFNGVFSGFRFREVIERIREKDIQFLAALHAFSKHMHHTLHTWSMKMLISFNKWKCEFASRAFRFTYVHCTVQCALNHTVLILWSLINVWRAQLNAHTHAVLLIGRWLQTNEI